MAGEELPGGEQKVIDMGDVARKLAIEDLILMYLITSYELRITNQKDKSPRVIVVSSS